MVERWEALSDRGGSAARTDSKTLPLHLVNELVERVGMTPETAIELSLQEALQKLNRYWSEAANVR